VRGGVRPILIHPVDITVRPIDTAATSWDRSAREPIPQVKRTALVAIKAQRDWRRREHRKATPAGPVDEADGFFVFLRRDLDTVGWVPEPGDRIETVEGEAVELYLLSEGQRRGTYSRTGHTLKAPFGSRRPRRD